MISDELLSKFDRIEDLPVSEEMLGAYMENSLSDQEAKGIADRIEVSQNLANLINSVECDVNTDDSLDSDPSVLDGVLDWINIDLPEVSFAELAGLESFYFNNSFAIERDDILSSDTYGNSNFLSDDDRFDDDDPSLEIDDIF